MIAHHEGAISSSQRVIDDRGRRIEILAGVLLMTRGWMSIGARSTRT
jgi:hypothetical protein